jgi:hypothetical protein
MIAVKDSPVVVTAAAFLRVTEIVAAALRVWLVVPAESVVDFDAVTTESDVAEFVSPMFKYEVAVVATLSSEAAVVTVIVNVCAAEPTSAPEP